MSVSCTSNLLAQMFDFPKCIRVLLMFIMSLQSLLQNENLETNQIVIVVLYSHITKLPKFTCMMNVRDQTIQSFVTGFVWSIS